MDHLFTFWEGDLPVYIEKCIDTWHGPYIQTFLNYRNLKQYTDFDIESAKRFSLPQIADCVRVHVLRDNGGYWLDADTIMLSDKLPTENIMGYPDSRTHTIGFLHTEKDSEMYREWAAYQDKIIADPNSTHRWNIMGNAFTDDYIRDHEEITIHPIAMSWAETYMIQGTRSRRAKYEHLYFNETCTLNEFLPTDLLMLHNSWTPDWYKWMTENEFMNDNHTLSNILKELSC